jgi:hypothetical protein
VTWKSESELLVRCSECSQRDIYIREPGWQNVKIAFELNSSHTGFIDRNRTMDLCFIHNASTACALISLISIRDLAEENAQKSLEFI